MTVLTLTSLFRIGQSKWKGLHPVLDCLLKDDDKNRANEHATCFLHHPSHTRRQRVIPASEDSESNSSPHIPSGPKRDFSLKEGQTISISLGGRSTSQKKKESDGLSSTGGSMPLLPPPPPPRGRWTNFVTVDPIRPFHVSVSWVSGFCCDSPLTVLWRIYWPLPPPSVSCSSAWLDQFSVGSHLAWRWCLVWSGGMCVEGYSINASCTYWKYIRAYPIWGLAKRCWAM